MQILSKHLYDVDVAATDSKLDELKKRTCNIQSIWLTNTTLIGELKKLKAKQREY